MIHQKIAFKNTALVNASVAQTRRAYLGQVFLGLGVELQRRRRGGAKAGRRIECGARAALQLLRGLAHARQSLVEGLACVRVCARTNAGRWCDTGNVYMRM